MGLDIRVYSGLMRIGEYSEDKDCDDLLHIYQNPYFQDRCSLKEGVYSYTKHQHVWRGGYGYYGSIRELIAKAVGYPAEIHPTFSRPSHQIGACYASGGMFWELLSFSDCEGFLDAAVCEKLYQDFIEFEIGDVDEDVKNFFSKMIFGLNIARKDGCMQFT